MLHGIDIRLLYLHVLTEVGSEETLTEIEVETAACHVHTWVEVGGAVGWGGLQTDTEDSSRRQFSVSISTPRMADSEKAQ